MTIAGVPSRIDRAQLRAHLQLILGQAFRKGISPLTGGTTHPLRQAFFSFGFMGLLFCANLRRVDGADEFLARLFLASAALVIAGISPDAADVRQRNVDVLSCRPLSGATRGAAQAITLVVIGLILCAPLIVAPLGASWLYLGVPAPRVLLAGGVLLIQAATLALLWIHIFTLALRWFSVESLRRVTQVLVLLVALGVTMGSYGMVTPLLRAVGLDLDAVPSEWSRVLPSSWFAALIEPGFDLVVNLQRLAALVVVAVALGSHWPSGLERRQRRYEVAMQAAQEREASAPVVQTTGIPRRILGLLGRALSAPTAAVANAILLHGERDDMARMRRMSNAAMSVVFFAFGTAMDRPGMRLWMLTYVGCSALVAGADFMRFSRDSAAGWIFFTSPVAPRHVVAGMQVASILGSLLLPGVLTAVSLGLDADPVTAFVSFAVYLIAMRLVSAALLRLRPGMPLSTAERTYPALVGFGLAVVVAIIVTAWLGAVQAAMSSGSAESAAVVGLSTVVALLVAVGLERSTARQLGRLEHG